MSLNSVILNGKLPHFEGNYKAGEGDKKSFLSWAVSVQRDFKPADAQYYPEDLINFKAFGPTADFINKNFAQGDGIVLSGRIQKDDDYEVDGETRKGQLFVLIEKASFAVGRNNGESAGSAAAAPKAPGKVAPKAPSKAPVKPPVKKPGSRPWN